MGNSASAREANFDGLVGPTHNYAGLAAGNLAAQAHAGNISHPKAAALEGLAKMKFMADLGIPQAVLPPHPRPNIPLLTRLGFSGTPQEAIAKAAKEAPHLLAHASSAAAMWTANAATISPSADTADSRIHITPANLTSHLHRAIEASFTARLLKQIFPEGKNFSHHDPLPACETMGDEGAANHMRLGVNHAAPGVEVFVYGKTSNSADPHPLKYPARQTQEASQAIARLHQLKEAETLFVQQHPEAIDAGVFHNDVAAVANENVMFFHERAYLDTPRFIAQLQAHRIANLHILQVREDEVSLIDAVNTYLFNSQIITLPSGEMVIIAPSECERHPGVRKKLDALLAADNPISSVHYLSVRESMKNGGGPACLRLRVVLTEEEYAAVHPGIWLNPKRYQDLVRWVNTHYRDQLSPADLAHSALLREVSKALIELADILELPNLYASL